MQILNLSESQLSDSANLSISTTTWLDLASFHRGAVQQVESNCQEAALAKTTRAQHTMLDTLSIDVDRPYGCGSKLAYLD